MVVLHPNNRLLDSFATCLAEAVCSDSIAFVGIVRRTWRGVFRVSQISLCVTDLLKTPTDPPNSCTLRIVWQPPTPKPWT